MESNTQEMSRMVQAAGFLMNLATIKAPELRIISIQVDARPNLTIWVHPDDHIALDDLLLTVSEADRKTKKEAYHKGDHDLLIFERHFFIKETSVITMSSYRDFHGGEE